jgi:hypothetical protein
VKLQTLTQKQLDAAEKTLSAGTWAITAGAILYSVLTVTPLVERVTPDGWGWTAPILPLVVDAAVVIVVRLDATVARLGERAGAWPAILRWLTGCMTIALNIGDSALKRDWVGVGVHLVAPVLLIVTAEAGLAYRRAISRALERIAREQAVENARADRERREREERDRQEREAAREADERRRREEREEREREEERAERRERERLEYDAKREREEREHAARLAREERDHEANLRAQEAEQQRRAEEQRRADLDRQEAARRAHEEEQKREHPDAARAAAEEAARIAGRQTEGDRRPVGLVSAAASTSRPVVSATVSTVSATKEETAPETAHDAPQEPVKLPEADALEALAKAVSEGKSQREIAALTGWSTGWVAKHCKALAAKEAAAA